MLISCGGISDGKEAYTRIKDGASLVQIFTSFIFKGPKIAYNINSELASLLRQDGLANITEAIGLNLKK